MMISAWRFLLRLMALRISCCVKRGWSRSEIDRQVAPVNLREAHGVLLRGDDDLGLAFLAAVDGVEDFLLREAVMVHETLGIDEFAAEFYQALFEAFRLGDAAQRRDFFALEKIQAFPFAAEHILEIQRMMHAFDEAGLGIMLGDAGAQSGGVAVALGDENRLRAREVRRRLAQRAAGPP